MRRWHQNYWIYVLSWSFALWDLLFKKLQASLDFDYFLENLALLIRSNLLFIHIIWILFIASSETHTPIEISSGKPRLDYLTNGSLKLIFQIAASMMIISPNWERVHYAEKQTQLLFSDCWWDIPEVNPQYSIANEGDMAFEFQMVATWIKGPLLNPNASSQGQLHFANTLAPSSPISQLTDIKKNGHKYSYLMDMSEHLASTFAPRFPILFSAADRDECT